MKKWMSVLLIMVMAMSLMAGCAPKAEEPAAEAPATEESTGDATEDAVESKLDEIKAKGKLVLGTSADYPPYEFHKEIDGNDTIVGFDIDIAKKIADDMGVELEILDMKFDGLLPALVAGKIDFIVAGMTPTDERKEAVDFSIVYYEANQSMVVPKDMVEELTSIEAFAGKTLAVQKATIQEDMAKESFTESNVKGIAKIPNLIMELKTGKADGVLLAEPVAKAYVAQNDDLAVANIELGSEGGVAIAIQKDSPELVAAINESLQSMLDNGEIDAFITAATELQSAE